jgi:hypothetical protein
MKGQTASVSGTSLVALLSTATSEETFRSHAGSLATVRQSLRASKLASTRALYVSTGH